MNDVEYASGNREGPVTVANLKASHIISINKDGMITSLNPKAESLFYNYNGSMIGQSFLTFVHQEDRDLTRQTFEEMIHTQEVRHFHIRMDGQEDTLYTIKAITIINNGLEKEILLIICDHRQTVINRGKSYVNQTMDLYDKEDLLNDVEVLIQRPAPFTLVSLKVDHIKKLIGMFGKEAELFIFQNIFQRINQFYSSKVNLYRMNNDEVALVLNKELTPALQDELKELLIHVNLPINYKLHEMKVNIRMGIVRYPEDADSAFTLFHHSDMALEMSDRLNKPCYVFEKNDESRFLKEIRLEREVFKSVTEEQFILHYQPIVNQNQNRIVGFEALLRWDHPEFGMIPPNEFIPLLESTGLIVQVGYQSIKKACQQIKIWEQKGFNDIKMHVNLSVRQLFSEELVLQLENILAKEKINPKRLTIEITESMIMEDSDHFINMIDEIRNLGIEVSIDDFGTGYSALSYLTRLNVDSIKIDQSFVQQVGYGDKGDAVIKSIISLARHLDLNVIAEGVEEEKHISFLLENECSEMQGFYFSKPLTEYEANQYLFTYHQKVSGNH